MQVVATVNLCNSKRRKVSVEDVEKLAASASLRQGPDSQGTALSSHA